VEDWALIRRLIADGVPQPQVARDLGIGRSTVERALASDRPPKSSGRRCHIVHGRLETNEPVAPIYDRPIGLISERCRQGQWDGRRNRCDNSDLRIIDQRIRLTGLDIKAADQYTGRPALVIGPLKATQMKQHDGSRAHDAGHLGPGAEQGSSLSPSRVCSRSRPTGGRTEEHTDRLFSRAAGTFRNGAGVLPEDTRRHEGRATRLARLQTMRASRCAERSTDWGALAGTATPTNSGTAPVQNATQRVPLPDAASRARGALRE
jgi:hypothetical protein